MYLGVSLLRCHISHSWSVESVFTVIPAVSIDPSNSGTILDKLFTEF